MVITKKEELCAIMRLWYGIRCVYAHGIPDETLKRGVLKSFFKCSKGCSEVPILKDCRKLCKDMTVILGKDFERDDDQQIVFNEAKRYPDAPKFTAYCAEKIEDLKRLGDGTEGDREKELRDAIKGADVLIRTHWKDKSRDLVKREYPTEFGWYQLYRIYNYLKDQKRAQFITYRLFVRINQFLLQVAFRIKLAVAQWLAENDDIHDLKNLWGYRDDERYLKELFKREEEKHTDTIKEIKHLAHDTTV